MTIRSMSLAAGSLPFATDPSPNAPGAIDHIRGMIAPIKGLRRTDGSHLDGVSARFFPVLVFRALTPVFHPAEIKLHPRLPPAHDIRQRMPRPAGMRPPERPVP